MPAYTAAQMRVYRKDRYADMKKKMVAYLGGACTSCGSCDLRSLQIDHVDHKSKTFEVNVKAWCMSWKRLQPELDKCQLLCQKCHVRKTILERGRAVAKGSHGTVSSYRYCKCPLCRAANAAYCRDRRRREGEGSGRMRQPPEHGTSTMYGYHGCRCDACRAHNALRARTLRKGKKTRG